MMQRRQWRDLTPTQRTGALGLGAVEVVLFGAAQFDIWRRPAREVRGRKWMWAALAFINIFGPLAYFAFGRRR